MLFTLSPIHTWAHMYMQGLSTTHCPSCWGEKIEEKRREKKSIAGDSGARRRIVSCQNNILPSSPADRCGGLGTEGSLSPLSPSLPPRRSLQFNIYLRERAAVTALTPNWFRHLGLSVWAADERGRRLWNAKKEREREREGKKETVSKKSV